ncbi:probable metabolite transport protein YDR387C [Bombus vosnesenskii]|uniref:Probable metabolite transport protein YDR387C n=1 Tax=Bombus vosnesenskii TaxID=207650 RepID=A0A6J3LFG1_9HYME|nr:probable metabolite transport protein YDR387C [Bombus vosnesenskii]
MSQRRTVSRRSSQSDDFNPFRPSPEEDALMHYLSLIPVTLTTIIGGSVNGWTTISLYYLITGTGGAPMTITHDESSWMVSLTVLGSMIGSLVATQLAASSCSNICLVLCNTMLTIGWFTIYEAPYVKVLYIARVILGIGIGIGSTVNPMYLSEIVDIKFTGIVGFVTAANVSIASVLFYALGLWMMYKSLLLLLVILSFICFMSIRCFSAPRYLSVTSDQMTQTQQSMEYCIENTRAEEMELRALRAQTRSELHQQSGCDLSLQSRSDLPSQSTRELHQPSTSEIHPESTREVHPEPTSEIHPEPTSEIHPEPASEIHPLGRRELQLVNILTKYTCSTKLREILQGSNRKALFIMLGLIMAQQLSGNFITMQYLHVLFSKTTISLETHEATMVVLFADIISSSLPHLKVESIGRRKLLILSTLGSCSTLIVLAIYLLLDQHKFDVSYVSILPVIDLIIYQVMFYIGLGTLPNVLLRELFPTELKGSARAIIVIFDGIIGFTVPKLYQVITDNVGSYAIYFIFTISCFLAFVMVFIWVPETKGKTYHEIKALLVGENLNSPNEEISTDEMDSREI